MAMPFTGILMMLHAHRPANGALGFSPHIRHCRHGLEIAKHAHHPKEAAAHRAHDFVISS
jgi:hypothetical protein